MAGSASAAGCWPFNGAAREEERIQREAADKLVKIGIRRLKEVARNRKARQKAWTGSNDVKQEGYKAGEKAWSVNPHYVDGTRLRDGPEREAEFNGQSVLNDAEVEVLEVQGDFAKVRTLPTEAVPEIAEGWLRQRNLARNKSKGALAAMDPSERRIGLDRPPSARGGADVKPEQVAVPQSGAGSPHAV
jgi:hypothetical protein